MVARLEVVTETLLSCCPVTASRVDTRVVVVTLTSVAVLLLPLLLPLTVLADLAKELREEGEAAEGVEEVAVLVLAEGAAAGVELFCVVPAVALLQRCRSVCSCCCCRRAAAVVLLLRLVEEEAAECEEGVLGSCELGATSVSEMPLEAACSAAERLRRYRAYSSAQSDDASPCLCCCVPLLLSATARARAAR